MTTITLETIQARQDDKYEYYWSGEVFEADTSSAWGCHLLDGLQAPNPKSYEANVTAVRRIPIGG